MFLVDWEIQSLLEDGHLEIIGGNPVISGSTMDLTLDTSFEMYESVELDEDCGCRKEIELIDSKHLDLIKTFEFDADEIVLNPGDCVLASTAEYLKFPNFLTGLIGGRSTIARLFVMTHVTSPIVKPGFEGKITLELVNLNHHAVKLYAGMPILNLLIEEHESCTNPYDGKYQGQDRATGP